MLSRRFARAAVLYAICALPVLVPRAIAQQQAPASPVRLAGQVTDAGGRPLAGAAVSIAALRIGATVTNDGAYALPIPAARVTTGQRLVVVVRLLGYKADSQTVIVTGTALTLDFVLALNPLLLGEVVVTGEGTSSAIEKLGTVHTSVDTTLLQTSGETNIVNALAAKAPNVEVRSASGDPGASSSIHIRGINTLTGSGQPLFVVDGVPIDNSTVSTETVDRSNYYAGSTGGTQIPNRAMDIDPNDIASIEILKGAAAGSIYGARAGQGVILITTKHGQSGPTKVSLRTSTSIDQVSRTPDLQMEYGQGSNGLPDACAASTGPENCYAQTGSWGPKIAPGTPVYNHATDLLQLGHTYDAALTMSGGGDRTQFFLSGAYSNQQGIFAGTDDFFRRIPLRFTGSHQLADNLKVTASLAYTYSTGRFEQKGSNYGGIYTTSLRAPPDFNNAEYLDPISGLQRSYQFPHPGAGSAGFTRGLDNPFFDAYEAYNGETTNRTFGNVAFDYHPLSWLTVNENLGLDTYTDNRLEGFPQTSSDPPSPLGQVIMAAFDYRQLDQNLTATASYTATDQWSGAVTVGQNLNTRTYRSAGQIGDELIAPQPFNLENTQLIELPTDLATNIHSEGYFGQATADLFDQLFLKGGVRYDGSSTFGNANRSWFPSGSAAWQFTSLPALHNALGFLSYGKLRAAYGEVGTEPSPYVTNVVFVTGSFGGGGTSLSSTNHGTGGLFTGSVRPSNGLRPERTKEFETGLDLAFFNDRVDAGYTWYNRRSSDVILNIPVPSATGYSRQTANGAELQNRGSEATLDIHAYQNKDVSWDVGFKFGMNRNRVISLLGAQFVSYSGSLNGFSNDTYGSGGEVARVGYPVGVFQGTDFARCGRGVVLPDGTDVDAQCGAQGVADHALYISASGFPVVDPTERIIGDPNPKWTGGIHTTFRYHHLSISGLLDIRHGGDVANETRGILNQYGATPETLLRGETKVFGQDYMPGPVAGPGAGQPAVLSQTWFKRTNESFAVDAPFIEDGGFVKLREVSLGYTLTSGPLARALGLSSAEIRLAGRNLVTWTKYSGVDPETNLTGAETGSFGVDYFNDPQTRSFILSLTLYK